MPLTPITVKTDIWDRTGLNSAELQESVLDSAIRSALVEFSRHRSRTAYGNFNVLLNTTDYVFPTSPAATKTGLLWQGIPAGVTQITQFYYAPQTILGNMSFEEMILTSIQGNIINLDFGGNIFENPSLIQIWFTKLREFRDTIGLPDWRVIEDSPRILQLLSVPTEATTAFWEGTTGWAIGDILPEDYEAFTKCTLWKAAETRAMKLAVAKTYREGNGISIDPAFDFWTKQAASYKGEFLADVGHGRGVLQIG